MAGAVAEPLECLSLGVGNWLGDGESLGGGLGSTLELGAALAGTVTEVLDCLRVRGGGCHRLDGGDGEEGDVDDGEDLHAGG